MQTKAQKEIRRLERLTKRTQRQTWNDMTALLEIVKEGGYTQRDKISQRDKSSFYRKAMKAISTLCRLERKTRENASLWKEADVTIQRLLQIARGGDG